MDGWKDEQKPRPIFFRLPRDGYSKYDEKKNDSKKNTAKFLEGLKSYHQDVQFQEEVISSQQNEICSFEGAKTIFQNSVQGHSNVGRKTKSQSQLLQL